MYIMSEVFKIYFYFSEDLIFQFVNGLTNEKIPNLDEIIKCKISYVFPVLFKKIISCFVAFLSERGTVTSSRPQIRFPK